MWAGKPCGIQLHVVARAAPEIARAGKQIVDLVALAGVDVQIFERQVHEPRLLVVRIEVDHHQDLVHPILGALGEGDDLVVLRVVKAQVGVGLKCGIVTANLVDAADQRRQAVGAVDVPLFDLELLGIQVFFLPRRQRRIVHELVGRPVDPVARPQRCRQDETRDESRAPAVLQRLGQDVRRVGPQVRPAKLAHLGLGQLREVFGQLPTRVAPGEVVVGLREAELGQTVQ